MIIVWSEDLATGYDNTLDHRGLYLYLAGLLAMDDGQKDEGIRDLQKAYSTWESYDGPWLLTRIQKDLAVAGANLPAPEPAITLSITPNPAYLFTPVSP